MYNYSSDIKSECSALLFEFSNYELVLYDDTMQMHLTLPLNFPISDFSANKLSP